MSTRAERKARRNAARCRNCGEFGAHYAPPCFGSPGLYTCTPRVSADRASIGGDPSEEADERLVVAVIDPDSDESYDEGVGA